jgi:pyruvate dehydrogenase E1 component alpha subunit
LNLAVVWKLPVVFVCENNLYMEYTPIESVTAVKHPAADRASAYGLESILVDGNDADVMYETARRTIDKARAGGGPSLVEALTYRHGGHSRADPAKYRPEAEVREWLARDPITRYRPRLLEAGIGEPELREIETLAQQKVDAATEEARRGAPATVDEIERQVWSDGGAGWRN